MILALLHVFLLAIDRTLQFEQRHFVCSFRWTATDACMVKRGCRFGCSEPYFNGQFLVPRRGHENVKR